MRWVLSFLECTVSLTTKYNLKKEDKYRPICQQIYMRTKISIKDRTINNIFYLWNSKQTGCQPKVFANLMGWI